MTDSVEIHTYSKSGIFDHDERDESVAKWLQWWRMARLRPKTSILPFPVVDRCRNRLRTAPLNSTWSKISDLSLEFRSYVSYGSRDIFPVLAATSPFPVIGRCRNHLATLWSKMPDLSSEFHNSRDLSISDFGSHFLLSVIIGIAYTPFTRWR